jgi:hypothetical protein
MDNQNKKECKGSGEKSCCQSKSCCGGKKHKTTIPPERKAPDTDDEGIGIVHKPQ